MVNDEIWLRFGRDGELLAGQRAPFPGGVRFVSSPETTVPATLQDARRANLPAMGASNHAQLTVAVKRALFEARLVTEELMEEYPEATWILGIAAGRIEEIFTVPRRRRWHSGLGGTLLCRLGLHRLIPMQWLTRSSADHGLVCRRCFKEFLGD